ncbi:MAG: hypothetical protein AAF267_15095 [Deinococcota bacterium]
MTAVSQHPLLFIFLDGVGLGADDPLANPFVSAQTPTLTQLLGGPLTASSTPFFEETQHSVLFNALDAHLGVSGLPQSATGQTALLTGRNAAEVMGRHYGPYPGPTLKGMLGCNTLFHDLVQAGQPCTLANVYPPQFYSRAKVNAIVYAAQQAGLRLRGLEEYQQERAISADLDGQYLAQHQGGVTVQPHMMGSWLATLAAEHNFTMFDFWLSDTAGHRWSFAEASDLVTKLDAFLGGVLAARPNQLTVMITSDHGNLEDKTRKSHSHALVPFIVVGPAARVFTGAESLVDVAPAVRQWLGVS